jgi:hypothetical protein
MSAGSLCRLATSLDGVKQDEMGECYAWPTSSPDRLEYNRLTSCYFLCGLVAFGQKNDRAYLQLAWIPFRLWSLEAQPAEDRSIFSSRPTEKWVFRTPR